MFKRSNESLRMNKPQVIAALRRQKNRSVETCVYPPLRAFLIRLKRMPNYPPQTKEGEMGATAHSIAEEVLGLA
jgi:hypothetical protein